MVIFNSYVKLPEGMLVLKKKWASRKFKSMWTASQEWNWTLPKPKNAVQDSSTSNSWDAWIRWKATVFPHWGQKSLLHLLSSYLPFWTVQALLLCLRLYPEDFSTYDSWGHFSDAWSASRPSLFPTVRFSSLGSTPTSWTWSHPPNLWGLQIEPCPSSGLSAARIA